MGRLRDMDTSNIPPMQGFQAAPVRRPRRRYTTTVIPGVVAAVDFLVINLAATAAYLPLVAFNPVTLEFYLFCTWFVAFVVLFLMARSGLYELDGIMRPMSQSDFIISSVIVAFLLFLTIVHALKAADIFATRWLWAFFGASIVLLTLSRVGCAWVLRGLGRREVIGRAVVVLGTGEQARRFLQKVRTVKPYFTHVAGVFDPGAERTTDAIEGFPVLGGFADLVRHARAERIDDVVIAMPWSDEHDIERTVQRLRELPVNIAMSTDLAGFRLAFRPVMGSFAQLPVFEVVQRPISGWSSVLKIAEDYVLTILLLVILAPLLIAVAVAIRLDSPGPVLFRQRRLGFNNEVFWIYKFRSMHHRPLPEAVTRQATRGDPRVTRVGRFIRRTSIDELPQLLNVLEGTMSLVGPRPHAVDHNEDFGRQIRGYFARHKVKPGITGWAQVNGLRGETNALAKLEARVRHDIYYAENWSLLFDLRILATTAFVVLFHRNAY